ncbi:hypothetical protein KIPB_014688, partial [Kipferlia bialata]
VETVSPDGVEDIEVPEGAWAARGDNRVYTASADLGTNITAQRTVT